MSDRGDYFGRVRRATGSRFWINNPTTEEVELALRHGAMGCTTNPGHGGNLLARAPQEVLPVIERCLAESEDDEVVATLVQRRLVARLCERFLPLFESSGGTEGFVSIQGAPEADTDGAVILADGPIVRRLCRGRPGQGQMSAAALELRERLLFATPPEDFAAGASAARESLADRYGRTSPQQQDEIVEVLRELVIDLSSYLVRWHLLAAESRGRLDTETVRREADQGRELLRRWGARDALDVIAAEVESIERSNLRRLSELADRGAIDSRWGHDAATGLTWAVRRGAVLVTTNPVMVNTVRKEDPATWIRSGMPSGRNTLRPRPSSAHRS